jgi:hypothetical protein
MHRDRISSRCRDRVRRKLNEGLTESSVLMPRQLEQGGLDCFRVDHRDTQSQPTERGGFYGIRRVITP